MLHNKKNQKLSENRCLVFLNDMFLFCSVILLLARNKGEGWSPAESLKPPSSFIVGRPKSALLSWFFGDFRCGALLLMVILVIYKYKNWEKLVVKC